MKFITDSVLRKCKMEKGETEVIIPDGVTEIGDWAFSSCTSLQSVTIPDSVTFIGESAFENCTSLQSVTIPDSVTEIGERAFENCKSLQSVTIPDSVTEIGCFAFFKCTGLQSLTIPGGVTMIYINAFSRCDSLKSVTWNREITAWSWQKSGIRKMDLAIWFVERFLNGETFPGNILKSNMKYLKSRKKKWIEKFSSNILLLQYFIKTEAFNLEDTEELLDKFSDSVEITAMLLDYKNKHFSKEYIEKKENDKIDKELGLKELTIADWKKRFTLGLLGDDTYEVRKYKGSDTFVEIPECIGTKKVSGIGEKAFTNCTSLESVTIPDSVTEIGDSAFRNCTSLQSVTIPDNISFISPNAFDNTPFIENSQKDSMIIFGKYFNKYTGNASSVTIPDGITVIGDNAFENCTKLQSITMPDSVTTICRCAFKRCTCLQSVTIPDSVTEIGESAFENCISLQLVTIPGSVTKIGRQAFSYCPKLRSVTIPNSVTIIDTQVFYYCIGLESVTIPDSVTAIDDYAFYGCNKLVFRTTEGSYAERYAKENSAKVEIIT